MELKNKTILITGGTSGIGLVLIKKLYYNNKIIVIAQNALKLQKLKEEFQNIMYYQCDLNNIEEIINTSKTLLLNHADISVLINNAGIQFNYSFLDFNNEIVNDIQKEITVNLNAPILLVSSLLPILIKHKESAIVNVSSGLALSPKQNAAVYCATKAGLHSFSISLRAQLLKTSVKVIEALPPLVDTPMTSGRGKNKLRADKVAESIIQGITKGKEELYIGKTIFLKLLMRLWPKLARKIMLNL